MARSTNKLIAAVTSAAMVASLCPISAAFAQDEALMLEDKAQASLEAPGQGLDETLSLEETAQQEPLEAAEQGLDASLLEEEPTAIIDEQSQEWDSGVSLFEDDAMTTAKALIAALPTTREITAAAKGTYDDQIAAAAAAYNALDSEGQKELDSTLCSGQSYGRVLESCEWALSAIGECDNSTTLAAGIYTAETTPALSSEYSKGKSTSPRQRPWSVASVTVSNGKAYATVTVESKTYSYIYMGGIKIENSAPSGSNSTFENVPIDLNSTQYLSAHSTSMPEDIAFSLTTTIDESASSNVESVVNLISALPSDPYKIGIAEVSQIHDAQVAYDALTDDEKSQVNAISLPSGVSCQRALEVAVWAVQSLVVVDNSTTLADGIYYLDQGKMKSDMGVSESHRSFYWSVVKISVSNGKATATLKRSGGNTPIASVYFEGRVLDANQDGTFTIPIALNSDMYFATKPRTDQTTDATVGLSYHINTAFDVEHATPDASIDDDAGGSGDSDNEAGDGGSDDGSSGNSQQSSLNTTGNTGFVGGGNTLSLNTASNNSKTKKTSTGSDSSNSDESGGIDNAASGAQASGSSEDTADGDSTIPPFALGGGFAGVALAGGAGFFALFRKREQH